MLARAESEYLFAHHDHADFKTVVVGPHVLRSLDKSLKINNEDLIRHPYPTWIIQTEQADFFLEHFSDFESGYEGFPDKLVRHYVDKGGNEQEEVLFQFERRNSNLPNFYEFELISGLDLSEIDRTGVVGKDDTTGLLGRIWVKKKEDLWKFFALVLTGHEKYEKSIANVNADISVISFLTTKIMPDGPSDSGYFATSQAA